MLLKGNSEGLLILVTWYVQVEDVRLLSLPQDWDRFGSCDVVSDNLKRGSSKADEHRLQVYAVTCKCVWE